MNAASASSNNTAFRRLLAMVCVALGIVACCMVAKPVSAWADEDGAIDLRQLDKNYVVAQQQADEGAAVEMNAKDAANPALTNSASGASDTGDSDAPTDVITIDPENVVIEPLTDMYVFSSIYANRLGEEITLRDSGEVISGRFSWVDPDDSEWDSVTYETPGEYQEAVLFTSFDSKYAPVELEATIVVGPAPFKVEGGIPYEDYEYLQTFGLMVYTDTPLTISMNSDGFGVVDGVSTRAGIVVTSSANITLNGVKIERAYDADLDEAPWALAANNGSGSTLTLTLEGENSLATYEGSALSTSSRGTLVIRGNGSLTARSTGTQLAEDPDTAGAGIGSDSWVNWNCGPIIIEGGTIHAIGSGNCAGIGGGEDGAVNDIQIKGGYIKAEAGSESANPIGGGNGVAGVTITGGCFADADPDTNTVYGITLPQGTHLIENLDWHTDEEYPWRAVTPIAMESSGLTAQFRESAYLVDTPLDDSNIKGGAFRADTGEEVKGDFFWQGEAPVYDEPGSYEVAAWFVPDGTSLPTIEVTVPVEVYLPAFNITGGERGVDYELLTYALMILSDTPMTISVNPEGYGVKDGVVRGTGINVWSVSANLTFDNLRVDITGDTTYFSPLNILGGEEETVTITLKGDNLLRIDDPELAAINHSTLCGPLVIRGDGSLEAVTTGDGAGIGTSGYPVIDYPLHRTAGNIIIESGTITASSGGDGAGIGGGMNGDAENIQIKGGYVTASSAGDGCAIGGGMGGNGVEGVTITGGYFADASAPAAELAEANQVYGVTPAAPAKVWANEDAATAEAYPVYVAETEKAPEQSGEQGGSDDQGGADDPSVPGDTDNPATPGDASDPAAPGDSQTPSGASGSLAATGDTTVPLAAASAALLVCAAVAITIARKRLN